MFVQTEFVRKSSASHTLQCYSTEMNSWNIIHGPLIELKRSHNLMFIGTLFVDGKSKISKNPFSQNHKFN